MKKVLLFTGILILASGITMAFKEYQARKNYTVSMPLEGWSNLIQGLELTKQKLRVSDLPAREVTIIIDSVLTPIQVSISQQVNATLSAEKKAADSLNSKKK